MSFTRAELEACRGRSVPDLIGRNLRLLFVGINPGLWTAAAQAHFARRGNRFYPALYEAGLSSREIDASGGMSRDDATDLISRGIGITNLVNKATARADELSKTELRSGAGHLEGKVASLRPTVVVILGVTAYRTAFDRPKATTGWQPEGIAPEGIKTASLLIAGNPSGLNAHQSIASLAAAFREAGRCARITMHQSV